MAIDCKPITQPEDWYESCKIDEYTDAITHFSLSKDAQAITRAFDKYKREMDLRVSNYDKLIKMVDAEVVSRKPDLPNISSGEAAGMIRRIARNLVQHTPNVEIINEFDDEQGRGVFANHILKTKIIGDDHRSNQMQQNLFVSTKDALTLGFSCVTPVLLQDALGGWFIKYDHIFYRDVFPEPGARDVEEATSIFIRRYMTAGELRRIVAQQPPGWDIKGIKNILETPPRSKPLESVDHQSSKHRSTPEGYEIITYYTNSGDPFVTYEETSKILLRIEKNNDPLKRHPVFFLVPEKDSNQPLGKSQVELIYGRQEFQDLMLNGAMKMWYRNINPSIIGYGTVNAIPNLTPGKFTSISNPNARVEALEVNTQTLMQYQSIATSNASNMIQLIGAADQQMATQGTGGMMSQTPQGVDAQQQMVDITTNNYQKAIEAFFSRYCSYALTLYFNELKGAPKITPSADARKALLNAGIPDTIFEEDGSLKLKMSQFATSYNVRTVPGSLVEMEDEKQLRMLNELFVPLSQAMPALAAAQDQEALAHATAAMMFIIDRQIELSGSHHSTMLREMIKNGDSRQTQRRMELEELLEQRIGDIDNSQTEEVRQMAALHKQTQEQISLLTQGQAAIMQQLGIQTGEPTGNPSGEPGI